MNFVLINHFSKYELYRNNHTPIKILTLNWRVMAGGPTYLPLWQTGKTYELVIHVQSNLNTLFCVQFKKKEFLNLSKPIM